MSELKLLDVPIVLIDGAEVPQYACEGDAGFDFAAIQDGVIYPGQTVLVRTGIKMAIPRGWELQVRPRSGMSYKTKLRVSNAPGTIDSGYRSEIKIIMENTSIETYYYHKGDRMAQGVFNEVPKGVFTVVDSLDNTERGEGGFGHTGA